MSETNSEDFERMRLANPIFFSTIYGTYDYVYASDKSSAKQFFTQSLAQIHARTPRCSFGRTGSFFVFKMPRRDIDFRQCEAQEKKVIIGPAGPGTSLCCIEFFDSQAYKRPFVFWTLIRRLFVSMTRDSDIKDMPSVCFFMCRILFIRNTHEVVFKFRHEVFAGDWLGLYRLFRVLFRMQLCLVHTLKL